MAEAETPDKKCRAEVESSANCLPADKRENSIEIGIIARVLQKFGNNGSRGCLWE